MRPGFTLVTRLAALRRFRSYWLLDVLCTDYVQATDVDNRDTALAAGSHEPSKKAKRVDGAGRWIC